MKQLPLKSVTLAAALAATSLPAAAQSNAQCDAMMMAGTQNYSPAAVANCTAYFQALADNAVAPGTFATVAPGALTQTLSTSGSGG